MHSFRQNCGSDTLQEPSAGQVNFWEVLAPWDPLSAPGSLSATHSATASQAGNQAMRNHLAAQGGGAGVLGWGYEPLSLFSKSQESNSILVILPQDQTNTGKPWTCKRPSGCTGQQPFVLRS